METSEVAYQKLVKLHSSALDQIKLLRKMYEDNSDRYCWLAQQFHEGKETNIGEWVASKEELDEYIDKEMAEDEEDEPGFCPTCNGSGEGQHDGSWCHWCGGSGEA